LGNQFQDEYNYVDSFGDEYEYDAFVGKWIKKRKEKRSQNPKVIARRIKQDEKRTSKGLKPRYPELQKMKSDKAVAKELQNPELEKIPSKSIKQIPVIMPKPEMQLRQEELKTMQQEEKAKQEEQKTKGLEKRVEQEDLKAENIKAKTQLMGAGKGFIWVVAGLAAVGIIAYVARPKTHAEAMKFQPQN